MGFEVEQAPVIYASLRSDLLRELRGFDETEAEHLVSTCPGWSVKDVMAHVSGLVAETLANVPLPRGSDEATARQVRDRVAMSLAEVCDEWQSNAAAFALFGEADPAYVAALTSDLLVHGHDIAESLGRPIDMASEPAMMVAQRYGELLQQRAADEHDMALHIDLIDAAVLIPGSGRNEITVRSPWFEFLRGVTGRRSRAEVEAFDWSQDPKPLLDIGWNQYGPFISE